MGGGRAEQGPDGRPGRGLLPEVEEHLHQPWARPVRPLGKRPLDEVLGRTGTSMEAVKRFSLLPK